MRLENVERGSGQPALGAVFGAVLLAAGGLAAVWQRLALPVPGCRFREWTGLPCPGCGSTRMIDALLSGDVAAAAGWNPLVLGALTAVLAWAVLSVSRLALGLPPRRLVLAPRERVALRWLVAGLLAAGWSYLVWRGV